MNTLKLDKAKFGTLYDGRKARLYTVSNGRMSFSATDYGCTITSISIPMKDGRTADVVLGCSTLEGFMADNFSFGALVGRFANRIGGAKFTLDGKERRLDANDNGANCLHGGFDRYEKKLWAARKIRNESGLGIEFSRLSPDGEQGFPGSLHVRVAYTLNEKNELTLEYFARPDAPTPVNLTNHAYFNLKGQDGGSVESHELQFDSSKFVEVDDKLIPTGKFSSVSDFPAYDFRKSKALGRDIKDTGIGYDHAFVIDGWDGSLRKFARLFEPSTGISMDVSTTLPACQIYTGNFIEGAVGKNGRRHHAHEGVCMETEHLPDAPNQRDFPSCIATPDNPYHAVTVYKFGFN